MPIIFSLGLGWDYQRNVSIEALSGSFVFFQKFLTALRRMIGWIAWENVRWMGRTFPIVKGRNSRVRLDPWSPKYIGNMTGVFHAAKLSRCSVRRWFAVSISGVPDGTPWGPLEEECAIS